MDNRILQYLYKRKNDGKMYDVSVIFRNKNKHHIDMFVVEMEANGLVMKRVNGYLNERAIPEGEDKTDANNSICKITLEGIKYYENKVQTKITKRLAIIAIIISCFAILISLWQTLSG
jgi:hypothetical protein